MSILTELLNENQWIAFYSHKQTQDKMRDGELKELSDFINKKEYLKTANAIIKGQPLGLPSKRLINKVATSKKRVVYTFSKEESLVLKLLARLLYHYDYAFSQNLYSFRQGFGVKPAISRLAADKAVDNLYSYKADIHNYFNSVDIELCIAELKEVISDDMPLFDFIKALLREERVVFDGEITPDSHGIMAGVPISSFLANVYLRKMDMYFEEKGVIYARYSDDIIVFAPTREQLEEHRNVIKAFLEQYKLEINPEKEVFTAPGEAWSFLGVQYCGGAVDISPVSLKKVKAKFRRKADALLRWKRKKNLDNIYAVKAFIKYVNRFFYSNKSAAEMTWARWYFPLITTSESLKSLDRYTVELIRYIFTEKHNKAMYTLKYEEIKQLGFRPLVAAFYEDNI